MDYENFSVLERYGENFTEKEYVTNPAIGRDKQIQELLLILLTPEKSAILIGKPGIGKTAIVEGLAYRMQRGEVPDALKEYSIINIKTASLLGTMPNGESKVQLMIDELKTKDKVILFVDEVHMLIGATDSSSLDFANIFKEGLGRGSIKVIGATTTEEYERYILRDKAFTRRFQKVEVPEPTRDETVEIMMGTLPKIEKSTGAKMKYTSFVQSQIMGFIVDITSEYKRVYAIGSRYPDISLTLLKQAFSYAVFDNRKEVNIFDVRKAIKYTKNVYAAIVKKELPNFDKKFKDIIAEEKEVSNNYEEDIEPPITMPPEMIYETPPEEVYEPTTPTMQQPVPIYDPAMDYPEKKKLEGKKSLLSEADKMILSGNINVITDQGIKKMDEISFPSKYDDKKASLTLDKATDYINYEKSLDAVPILDPNGAPSVLQPLTSVKPLSDMVDLSAPIVKQNRQEPAKEQPKKAWKFVQEIDHVNEPSSNNNSFDLRLTESEQRAQLDELYDDFYDD